MEQHRWWTGFGPAKTCSECGAAVTADGLCLAHLCDAAFATILDRLTVGTLTLDLRGVDIDNERWTAIRIALTPNMIRGPDLSSARLAHATLGDRAGLWRATFSDGADLRGVTFGDGASLRGALFGDGADLRGATFGDRADLRGATFGDRADLSGATFGDRADLSGATFGDGADLSGATFGDRANLRGATFGDGADLSRATFGDGASLAETWFVGNASLAIATFRRQQRAIGPLYAGGAIDFHGAQFGIETRLEVDADRVVLSRAVFAGPVEVRALRARIEASETRFEGRAAIGRLDPARRPQTKIPGNPRQDREGALLRHADAADASVWSLRRTDVSQLTIAGVRIDEARFAGAQGLERLRLIDTSFEKRAGRQRVAEEALLDAGEEEPTADEQRMGHPKATAEQVAEIYRSLRKSREDSADAPGGNDLYVGEQEMRRRALRELPIATRGHRALLALYAWVGGYGVRSVFPSAALVVLLGAGWALAIWIGLKTGDTFDALVFVLRSVLLLPNSDNVTTTTAGDGLQVVLRVLGPLLIGLIALGVRAQVKR